MKWLERYGLLIALAAAWIAMLGSLYFSEVAGYIPCRLCWYQRILMYPLTAIIAVGILRRDIQLPFYILPFSVVGIGVSTYHYMIQKTDLFGTGICQEGIPCSTIWINWLGFITIPFLALTAFMIITIMTLISMQTDETLLDTATATPWLPVAGTVGAIAFVFAILWIVGSQRHLESMASTPTALPVLASGAMLTDDGAVLYQQACAACHGPDMRGVTSLGNSLVESQFVADATDEELLAFIRAGRAVDDPANTSGLAMPASGGRPDLDDAQMGSIIAQMRAAQAAAQ